MQEVTKTRSEQPLKNPEETMCKAFIITGLALCVFAAACIYAKPSLLSLKSRKIITTAGGYLLGHGSARLFFIKIKTRVKPLPKPVTTYNVLLTYLENRETLESNTTGLLEENEMDELLKVQNYEAVLSCVWSEQDLDKKITWLKKQAEKGHPILMFELAVAYLEQDPTLEALVNTSNAWLYVGKLRTHMDALCSRPPKEAAELGKTLATRYATKAEEILIDASFAAEDIVNYRKDNDEVMKHKNISLFEEMTESLLDPETAALAPSPAWTFPYPTTQQQLPVFAVRKQVAEAVLKAWSNATSEATPGETKTTAS